jgi:hypothetical protein
LLPIGAVEKFRRRLEEEKTQNNFNYPYGYIQKGGVSFKGE